MPLKRYGVRFLIIKTHVTYSEHISVYASASFQQHDIIDIAIKGELLVIFNLQAKLSTGNS